MWHEHLRRNRQRLRGLKPLVINYIPGNLSSQISVLKYRRNMNQTCLTILLKDPQFGKSVLANEELGAIVRTGSCFCCTQNAGFPGIPRPQHDNVFCRGISPLFNWSACRQLWFCTTAIAVGLFFGCSGDHRTSERLARASKLWNVVVTCLLEMVVVPGDGIHQPPYEATEYGDHRSPQADRIISWPLQLYCIFDSCWVFGQIDHSKIEYPKMRPYKIQCS